MTLKKIIAFMDCDGCGAEMHVQLDTGEKHSRAWDLFDVAVDGCRGTVLENMSGFPSVQGNAQCLCPKCTKIVDDYMEAHKKPDRNATGDEIKDALDEADARAGR